MLQPIPIIPVGPGVCRGTWKQWLARIAERGARYGEALRPAVLEEADPAKNLGPLLDTSHPCYIAMRCHKAAMLSQEDVERILQGGCGCSPPTA
jgi:hypothetical protein